MSDFLTEITGAVKEGARGLKRTLGLETDPEMRIYSKLDDQKLDTLREEFGTDQVADYVKEMEARKMTRRK
jgi:hypothetical protein